MRCYELSGGYDVLLRSIQISHPSHADAAGSIASLLRQQQELSIIAQNLVEFRAVATRAPAHNGLGLSVYETAQTPVGF
jgi:hypothetical protein